MAIFKIQMQKKSFLWKRLRLDLIFTRFKTFFLCFFFWYIFIMTFLLWSYFLYWQPPNYFRKKSPWNQKHSDIFPRTWEYLDFFQSFYFQVFFPETFFPGLFYIDLFFYISIYQELGAKTQFLDYYLWNVFHNRVYYL